MWEKITNFTKNDADQGEQQEKETASMLDSAYIPCKGTLGAKIGWRTAGNEKGRGVFALEDISAGTQIEVVPVVPVATHNIPDDGGAPDGYLLDWNTEEEGEEHCLALGYIMLYNHSPEGNVSLENDYEEMTVTSTAMRDIRAGEEILWDYSCEIWFDEE